MKEKFILCERDAKRSKDSVFLELSLPEKSEMPVPEIELKEKVGDNHADGQLIHGDCREICGWLADQKRQVDLVYIDPPFATGSKFGGKIWLRGQDAANQGLPVMHYDDCTHKDDYLKWMAENLRAIRSVMSETASIYLHLDWHICHYVKILMDEIFGSKNFINEIVWTYKSGGASKGSFAKKHDIIYLYAKNKGKHIFNTQKEKSYNRDFRPYHFKGVEEYQDEKGWYTLVNMKDVWEINMVGRTSSERVDYATQKPEALIKRAIETSTDPGMLVMDVFGGSGTVAAGAAKLNRKFIHGDINQTSIQIARNRLIELGKEFEVYETKLVDEKKKDNLEELIIKINPYEEHWLVEIQRYHSEEIKLMVEKLNQKKPESVALSENGIEMIEWVSLDCLRKEGPWNSTKELSINKKGQVIEKGKNVKEQWDGTIISIEKPKRMMIRDISGKERIYRV